MNKDDLRIEDAYTITLSQTSKEKYAWFTLKVADASIADAAKAKEKNGFDVVSLVVVDDESVITRFNDEKAWMELELTRGIPISKAKKMTSIVGITRGVHSNWAYKKLETAYDGIVDFKIEDASEELKSFMRIRSMRNVHFDSRWHEVRVGENFEVTLEK